jgi:hypothetical protein
MITNVAQEIDRNQHRGGTKIQGSVPMTSVPGPSVNTRTSGRTCVSETLLPVAMAPERAAVLRHPHTRTKVWPGLSTTMAGTRTRRSDTSYLRSMPLDSQRPVTHYGTPRRSPGPPASLRAQNSETSIQRSELQSPLGQKFRDKSPPDSHPRSSSGTSQQNTPACFRKLVAIVRMHCAAWLRPEPASLASSPTPFRSTWLARSRKRSSAFLMCNDSCRHRTKVLFVCGNCFFDSSEPSTAIRWFSFH